MSALCIASVALTIALPLQSFTLAWTHSIEKIRWEEDYRIVGQNLELLEARIGGSGAGMEPPPDAVLKDGVWHYKPALSLLPRVRLARSAYVADYELCSGGVCRPMSSIIGAVDVAPDVELYACDKTALP